MEALRRLTKEEEFDEIEDEDPFEDISDEEAYPSDLGVSNN